MGINTHLAVGFLSGQKISSLEKIKRTNRQQNKRHSVKVKSKDISSIKNSEK